MLVAVAHVFKRSLPSQLFRIRDTPVALLHGLQKRFSAVRFAPLGVVIQPQVGGRVRFPFSLHGYTLSHLDDVLPQCLEPGGLVLPKEATLQLFTARRRQRRFSKRRHR